MKLKRIMVIVLCFAMVLSTMSFNVFAEEGVTETADTVVAKVGDAEFTDIQEAIKAAAPNGTVTLLGNVTVAEQLVIPEGVEVTIDLNGKTITGGLNGASTTNHIYVMANYGTLTITDSGEDGAIISRGVYNYGKLTLENGKIDACDCNGGYAVNNESGSVFIMNGGSVTADYEDGDAPVSGNYDATALDVPENCTATLNGGTISNAGNFTFAISVEGELIVPEDSTVSVTGVHGTVAVMGGEANIAGGIFKLVGSPNVTDSLIYVPSGTANITGGSFDASETLSSSGRIIGAYDSGKVTVNGGTFTSNGWFDFADSSIENVTVNDAICVDCDDNVKSYVAENATITLNGESYTAPDDGGSDGEEDTILINTVEDLIELRDNVNAGTDYYEGKNVKLNADINLENINWTPIGSASVDHGFMGNFDGNGHTIFNLTIEDPALDNDGYAYAGLFGVTEGTDKDNQNTIENLTIENVTISTTGHIVAAAIAYPYYTIVDNVKVCGNINITGGDYTAGVLAYTRRCVNAKDLTITGNDGSYIKGAQVVGGVISDIQMNGGLIADYSNFNAEGLTVKGELNVGGISGIIASQTLDTCSVKDVTLDCDDARVGTVAGCLGGVSTISNATVENVSGASALIGGTYDDGKSVEAKIGDKYYATLATAISAAESGDTVTLLCDVNDVVDIPEGVTLNTNGYKCIQAKGTWGGIDWTLTTDGTLTIAPTVNEITKTKPYSKTNPKELYQVGEVPAAVNDAITAITGWPFNRTAVKKLVIEEGVTSIGSFALQGLSNLTGEVVIPSTVTYIGQEAFQNSPMTKLTFAKGGTGELCIGPGAFKKFAVEELVLPADRPEIHIHCWAFNDCTSLKDVTLPANITTFSQWTHVEYMGMDYVNSGDSQIFARCKALESITFGSEEVKKLFFNAPSNKNNIDAIGGVEIKVVVPAVAKIGDVKYESLAEAIAVGGDVILLADVENAGKIVVNKDVSLDLNGKTISGVCDEGQKYVFMVNNGVAMNIKDSSAEKTGKITYAGNNSTGWIIDVKGNLVLESGTLELTGTWNIGYAVDVRPNAWGTAYTEGTAFVMNGGKIVSSDGAVRVASSSADTYKDVSASFTMNNGEIEAAWDGVFVQQSNAAWDVLNVTINNGTIKSALNPVRFYGPAATSYVSGEDCVDIALNGGTLEYTGTEAREWLVDGILRIGGGVSVDEFMKDSAVTASAEFATTNVADGYSWVSFGRKYRLQTLGAYVFVVDPAETELVEGTNETFTVDVKVASEKVDTFYTAEYIVKYETTLLTCAEDNAANDYDKKEGVLRLQALGTNTNVGESIGTLTFTAKEFDLTKETQIKVIGSVLATQFDSITGNSVEAAPGEGIVVMKETLEVTVGEGLEGDSVAYNGTDYVVSVAEANQCKQNTVTYTIGEEEYSVVLPAGTNEFTIEGDKIIGDMTFEIADSFIVTVIAPYVTGYALVLVEGTADGYTYDGHQMFKIERATEGATVNYNDRYGWLVDGSAEGTTIESVTEAAYKAITAGGVSASVETTCNVNSCFIKDGKINFQDVSAAYACQRIDFALTEADMYYFMELYLASDVNCDGIVNVLDTAMISNSYN